MFQFKKIAGALLDPLSIGILLLLCGVIFLWIGKKPSRGRLFVSLSLLWLLVFSTGPFPAWGLRALESGYRPASPTQAGAAEWVVVLGGGIQFEPDWPASEQLRRSSLKRTVEGVRLAALDSDLKLLVSGGRVFSDRAEAVGMQETAVQFGIAPARIVADTLSRDTEAQARNVKALVGSGPFLLVTSAWHLPRAMALFRNQGLNPIPAPADFLSEGSWDGDFRYFLPSADKMEKSGVVFHEAIGRAWAWIRRKA